MLCTCYNVKQGTSKGHYLSTTSKASPRLPIPSFGEQEALFAPAFRVLEDAISARAFPGAAVAVIDDVATFESILELVVGDEQVRGVVAIDARVTLDGIEDVVRAVIAFDEGSA